MTTIYLTQWQYQQVLDGMVSTHLDVLDHNHDGKITQLGDLDMAVQHRQSQNIACGNTRDYVYAFTDVVDQDEDGEISTDISYLGLSHENTQAMGYSQADIDFGGELYGYDLETLNKVIDYYNNGGSWNDDDFDQHVYEGMGATGELAPASVTGTANIDGYMDNPIQNDQLMWNDYVCNSLEDMLSMNGIDKSEMANYTTDSQGRISTITLTSGRVLWANYDLSQQGVTASFLSELEAAGATDIKYTADGMIASYKINGTTYNVSSTYGETAENDAYTQELLSQANSVKNQAEKAANNEKINALSDELTQNANNIENLNNEIDDLSNEVENDLQDVNDELNAFVKASQAKYEKAVEDAIEETKNQQVNEGEEATSFDEILSSKVSGGKFDISGEVASKASSALKNNSKLEQISSLTSQVSALNDKNASISNEISALTAKNFELDVELGNVVDDNAKAEFDFSSFGNFADFDSVNKNIEGFNLKNAELTENLDNTIVDFGTKENVFNAFTQNVAESGKIEGDKAVKKLTADAQ